MAILYQHKKPCGEIFYIGIGTNNKRPYSKSGRNKHWKNTVNKYGYNVEILYENLTWEEACKLEIALIKTYGRKDMNTGNLVNMTDGGEGTVGINKNRRGHNKNKPMLEEQKKKISISNKGNKNRALLILDTQTGIFYQDVAEASKVINMNSKTLNNHLKGISINKTNFIRI